MPVNGIFARRQRLLNRYRQLNLIAVAADGFTEGDGLLLRPGEGYAAKLRFDALGEVQGQRLR